MQKLLYASALTSLMTITACADKQPTRPLLQPSEASRTEVITNPSDTSDLVALPTGLYHRSCVYTVPDGGRVDENGVITTPSGQVVPHPTCTRPGPVSPRAPEVARSPWARGALSWGSNPPPTINSYVEYSGATIASGHVYRYLSVDWTVPPKPISYSSNVVYLFPSFENSTTIAQPVLQLGNNGFYSPGNNWIGAIYWCRGPNDPCYHGSSSLSVSPGDHLRGSVIATNCSGGKCDWTITISDLTTSLQISGTLNANVPHEGQTNDTYNFMHAGAMEAYNISTCDYLPAGPITFSNISVQNESGPITPYFTGVVTPGLSPQCGYYANVGTGPIVLSDSATTKLVATVSGPGVMTVGDTETWSASITSPHIGYPPYTYAWSGVLSGSGSSISGSPSSTGFLYLTVTDALGYQSSTQLYVSVCQPGQGLPC